MDLAAKKFILNNYETMGGERFYGSLIRFAIQKLADDQAQNALEEQARKEGRESPENPHKNARPEMTLLEYHNQFLVFYRREKLEVYREIAFHLRRAANKIYRLMLKQNLIPRSKNKYLLNLVG